MCASSSPRPDAYRSSGYRRPAIRRPSPSHLSPSETPSRSARRPLSTSARRHSFSAEKEDETQGIDTSETEEIIIAISIRRAWGTEINVGVDASRPRVTALPPPPPHLSLSLSLSMCSEINVPIGGAARCVVSRAARGSRPFPLHSPPPRFPKW